MAFDPDSYIANLPKAEPGFDPDAYIKSKALTPHAAEMAQPTPKKEEPGFFRRAYEAAAGGAHAIADVSNDVISSRGAALLDPSKRHQLERGLADVLTGGLANRAAEAVGNWAGDTGAANLQQTAAADAASNPQYRTAGNVAGIFAPSPFSWAGREAGAFLGGVGPQAVGKLPGAAMGVAKNLFGYEASAVPLAITQAASEGLNPIEAARAAATDPLGLTLSTVGGAAAGAGAGKANAIKDARGLSGRTLRDVKAAGGTINTIGEPVSGGLYSEAPELQNLKHGRAGVNELAHTAQEQILEHGRGKLKTSRSDYEAEMGQVLGENGGKPITALEAHGALGKMENDNLTADGKVIDPGKAKFINDMRGMLSSTGQQEIPQEPGKPPKGTPKFESVELPNVTASDLVKVKKFVSSNADWNNPATPENHHFRELYGALVKDAEAIDPRIGEINKKYGATQEGLKRVNDLLFGKNRTDIADRAASEKQATAKLGRIGDATQAATAEAPQIEELRQADPAYAHMLRLLEAKKAQERLRYSGSDLSTSIEGNRNEAGSHIGRHMVAGAMGVASGHPMLAVPLAVASGLLRNPVAADLRLKLPLAEAIGNTNPSKLGLMGMEQARKDQRVKEAERANAVAGRPMGKPTYVDRIEDDKAVLLDDYGKEFVVDVSTLPRGAKAGNWLQGNKVVPAPLSESWSIRNKLGSGDQGGNFAL